MVPHVQYGVVHYVHVQYGEARMRTCGHGQEPGGDRGVTLNTAADIAMQSDAECISWLQVSYLRKQLSVCMMYDDV